MEYFAIFLPLAGAILSYFGKDWKSFFRSSVFFICNYFSYIVFFFFYEGLLNNKYNNYKIFTWIDSGDFKVNWSINIRSP